jgi:hypothetical protein
MTAGTIQKVPRPRYHYHRETVGHVDYWLVTDSETNAVVFKTSTTEELHPSIRASQEAARLNGCDACITNARYGGGPSHVPSPLCKSGGVTPHCTCRACF